jgi:hypothetical protein
MTRPPFDPRDADTQPVELDPVARELERYADLTAGELPGSLAERVMASVAHEPTPRRGLLAALFGLIGADRGAPRLLLVGATMALGVLAVVLAGQIAGLLPDEQIGPSPSPSVIELPSVSPSPSPTPSAEPTATPRTTRSPRPSASPSASPSDDDERETPEPDETAEPSDDDNSGPGGGGGDGDDNSGPGGGGGDGRDGRDDGGSVSDSG